MPGKREASRLAKGALNGAIAGLSCDFAWQRERQGPPNGVIPLPAARRLPKGTSASNFFTRCGPGKRIEDGAGDDVR